MTEAQKRAKRYRDRGWAFYISQEREIISITLAENSNMAKRFRRNDRWPEGTQHYVYYADGSTEYRPMANPRTTLAELRKAMRQDADNYQGLEKPEPYYLPVALMHVMPKKS